MPARNFARPGPSDEQAACVVVRDHSGPLSRVYFPGELGQRSAAKPLTKDEARRIRRAYDPLVISRLGAVSITPDVENARKWYQIAADPGSAAASLPTWREHIERHCLAALIWQ